MSLLRFFGLALVETFGNIGIALGFTLLVVILLRPVTNRLLRPKYRVMGWMACCLAGYTASFYSLPGFIHLLPFTFRGWITPREHRMGMPAYFPENLTVGEQTIMLPGGMEIPFVMSETMRSVLCVMVAVGFVLNLIWSFKMEHDIKKIYRGTPPMDGEWNAAHGIDGDGVQVHIIEGLPTSFVCRMGGLVTHICLQKELPREQMELVLRHELKHIMGRHVWFKGILFVMMTFYWWNPVMWVAYRLACRDMELACDEAVMAELDEKQRRTYAHTLVELGSGKHMWGGLTCFGESDAALRVKNTVKWKRERRWTKFIVLPVLILAFLFLFTSPNGTDADRAVAWERYITGEFVEDFDAPWAMERAGEILEVRVDYRHNFNYLLVHTDNGRWHLCSIKWHPDEGEYWLSSHRWVNGPEKYEDYIPVEQWG